MSAARILVVDDEPGMVRSVERVLGARHRVAAFHSPRAALEGTADFQPDLAILDVRMPEMDGFELMAALKRACPGLDVILMTGSIDEHDAKLIRAVREDAFYFIQKPFDREVLLALVERCLAQRRLTGENRAHLVRLQSELEEARAFQRSILPPDHARLGCLTIASRYAPCAELGGDLHDFAAASGERAAVLIADVSGHGASAAMLTGVVKAAFHSAAADGFAPRAVVRRIATGLRSFGHDRFVTAVAARIVLDPLPIALEYVNAGHPPGIVFRRGRDPVLLTPTGTVISSAFPNADWKEERVDLADFDELLLYTDGIEDAFGETLPDWAAKNGRQGGDLLDAILDACREAAGGRPEQDDVTLMSVRAG